ncbi:hypothetical protein ACFVAD_07600 [Sutcliffiella sp. NPDC057660]|uniref:hypothetical protein n=1 Tax=Sutcliffiella sp. NPDC057660 TaxID=3346199 RepID=UPI0036CEA06F
MKKLSVKLFLMFVLLVSIATPGFAEDNKSINEELRETEINKLYDERAKLLLNEELSEKELDKALGKIDKKLEKIGVDFLTYEEVEEQFDIEKLAGDSEFSTMIAVPVQSNVSWSTYRSTVYHSTGTYNVQRLVAQPNSKSSNLKSSGFRYISSTYNWKAGSMNALKTVASSVAGEIPGASLALTVYDTVSGFASGISRETTVTDAEISYTWSQATTAVFSYVRRDSQSDSYQELTYISTKVAASIGYQYPTLVYSGGSVSPNVVQGKRNLNLVPPGYDSGHNAVNAYVNVYAPRRSTIDRITLTGLETKAISNIYPVSPMFPAQIN